MLGMIWYTETRELNANVGDDFEKFPLVEGT